MLHNFGDRNFIHLCLPCAASEVHHCTNGRRGYLNKPSEESNGVPAHTSCDDLALDQRMGTRRDETLIGNEISNLRWPGDGRVSGAIQGRAGWPDVSE